MQTVLTPPDRRVTAARTARHLALVAITCALVLVGCKKEDAAATTADAPSTDTAAVETAGAATDTAAVALAVEVTSDSAPVAEAPAAPEPPPPGGYSPERLRAIATQRFLQARAALPRFPRHQTMLEVLQRDFGVDYAARFPDGFDPGAHLTREQILLQVNEQLRAEADIQFPPATRKRLAEEVLTLFPLYRKGDRVKVLLANGRSEEGTITQVTKDAVQIGHAKVLLADIVKPDPVAFDPQATQIRRDHYLRVNYDNDRARFMQKHVNERVPPLLQENGFVKVEGENIRIDTLINERVMPEVSRLEAVYFTEAETQIKADIQAALLAEGLMTPPAPGEAPVELFVDLLNLPASTARGDSTLTIRIEGNTITVNDTELTRPLTTDSLVQALGSPTREVDLLVNRCLIWDDLGVTAFVNGTTGRMEAITLYLIERDRSLRQFPKRLFTGKLLVDDVPIAVATRPKAVNEHLTNAKYEVVEGRPGTWQNVREGFTITLTELKAGLQTVRISVD